MNRYGLSDQDLDKVYGIFEVTSYERHKSGFGHVPRNEFGFFKGYIHEILFYICEKGMDFDFLNIKKIGDIQDIDSSIIDLVDCVNVQIDYDTLQILEKNNIIKSYKEKQKMGNANSIYTIYNKNFNLYKANKIAKEREIGRILGKLNPDEIKFLREMDVLN